MIRLEAGPWAALLAVAMITTGCAVGRSEVQLDTPSAAAQAAPSKGKVVVIRTVKDERRFEESPSSPSTPSMDGGASKASADEKARAIGRKRNGYGMALGDVLLQPGRTVENVMKDSLAAGLRAAGYDVRDSATPGAILVDARIRKFWSWVTPGFASVTVEGTVEADVTSPGNPPLTLTGYAKDSVFAVTDDKFTGILKAALEKQRQELTTKAQGWR